ncbi:MAG: DUF3040 domain-containing protein [Propionibacteriaceae bacterium]|nr:DUF3040 domain-containing protein [Propionibacteriaceae bacterium]
MALSKDEQRLLEQMEAALEAEDPELASTLRGTTSRRLHTRRATLAGVAFVIGIACLIGGMKLHFALSIVGFVVMLAATIIAISSWRYVDETSVRGPGKPSGDSQFMDRLADRWRKRQDEGL